MTEQKNSTIFHLIIPASGTGERFGYSTPKQYAMLGSKPILRHTIEAFLKCKNCASIQIVINPDHEALYNDAVKDLDIAPPIYGGTTRKESVYEGLKALKTSQNPAPTDKILIHDAARPLITQADIQNIVKALDTHQAATLATPIQDTLRKDQNTVDRENLWSLQTPQGFHFQTIFDAHDNNANLKATDDTSLVSASNIAIELIQGSKTNIKITTPEDLKMAEKLLETNTQPQIRTGMGFDVHAFEAPNVDRDLILCGIKIDHPQGLKGHSDADVGLHALTDALLGAIGEGDIGTHFPPSDPTFKDMDSAIFLEKIRALLQTHNAEIINLDVTLICEHPKITPHREAMQNRIAEILDITSSQVNVKATTTEGLGFTGRREGIAAQAIATLQIK